MAEKITAAKMHGLGNAILIMDMRPCPQIELAPEFIRKLAAQPETKFDQLMLLYPPQGEKDGLPVFRVEIRNQDGSEAKACGNGTRCLAEWLYTYSPEAKSAAAPRLCPAIYYFKTAGGRVCAERLAGGQVRVDMGAPRFGAGDLVMRYSPANMLHTNLANLSLQAAAFPQFPQEAALASIGNPHAVFFIRNAQTDINALPLAEFGSILEHSPAFLQGVNVSLAQIISPQQMRLRVWERGAGLTLACGTAACAAQAAAHKLGLTESQAEIALPGGNLTVAMEDGHCLMTGPTAYQYSGEIDLTSGAFRRAA